MQISPKFQGLYVSRAETTEVGEHIQTNVDLQLTHDDKARAEKVLGPFNGDIWITQSINGHYGGIRSRITIPASSLPTDGLGHQQLSKTQRTYLTEVLEGITTIRPSVKEIALNIIRNQQK